MLYQIIIVFHILLGIGIIGLVLMQQGKGADAGAAFGSGASGSVFGAQGSASFLSRTTAIFATMFFVTSLGLAFLSGSHSKKSDIILDAPAVKEEQSSDVPLSQSNDNDVPVAKLPEAPAIKEVEPATATEAE
ncbi:preprotein translocase subunit SecG [Methylomonas sp. MgM2]